MFIKHRSKDGFLLLEAIFAISVLSIIMSVSISKMRTIRIQRKYDITQQNYETIKYSIAAFLFRNNRLPKASNSMQSGVEQSSIISGYIPYKTLGISASCAVDGNGKPIYYTPHPDLTKNFEYINYDSDKDIETDESLYFCGTTNYFPIKLYSASVSAFDENNKAIIAYVISDKKVTFDKDVNKIEVSKNTFWITRDLLITRYLKLSPCKCMNTKSHINLLDDDLF